MKRRKFTTFLIVIVCFIIRGQIASGDTMQGAVYKLGILLREAVAYTEKKSVVIVAAVGNDNEKNPEKIYYPAALDALKIRKLSNNPRAAIQSAKKQEERSLYFNLWSYIYLYINSVFL